MIAPSAKPGAIRPTTGAWELIAVGAYLLIAGLIAAALLLRFTQPPPGVPRDLAAPLWTMAVGIVSNSSCAILGCYLVLRRMSLLGDAISHAVLPGIAIAFFLSGSVSGWPIFIGAMVLGILTSALTQAISSLARVSEDTSLGVVFTSLFALGVIMLQTWARNADLDADCVFYGQIDYVAADTTAFFGAEISRPLLTLIPTLAATVLFVALFWKELKIVAFDPALAAAMGLRVAWVHYLFMAMVACVSVAAFESVGAILVVAMLIVPSATALLMSERILGVISWSVAFGATSAVFGYLAAMAINTSVAGAMATVAGLQLAIAVFAAPRSGIISRWVRNQLLAVRIAAEDILTRLYRAEERPASVRSEFPGMHRRGLIGSLARWRLSHAGWVEAPSSGGLRLTDSGRAAAVSLIRAHRLWETYLDAHFDLPRDHLHDAAERMEHYLGPDLQDELAAELADRPIDPHGRAIPTSSARPQ